jgi:hypothetical protein
VLKDVSICGHRFSQDRLALLEGGCIGLIHVGGTRCCVWSFIEGLRNARVCSVVSFQSPGLCVKCGSFGASSEIRTVGIPSRSLTPATPALSISVSVHSPTLVGRKSSALRYGAALDPSLCPAHVGLYSPQIIADSHHASCTSDPQWLRWWCLESKEEDSVQCARCKT